MLQYLADEDFDNRILPAIRRESPEIDWVRVQDIGLSGAHDAPILLWAAGEQRVVLTHDVSTMTATAVHLVRHGHDMGGIVVVPQSMAVGRAVKELIFLALVSEVDEWCYQVLFLPI